jgi:hypothetical protein
VCNESLENCTLQLKNKSRNIHGSFRPKSFGWQRIINNEFHGQEQWQDGGTWTIFDRRRWLGRKGDIFVRCARPSVLRQDVTVAGQALDGVALREPIATTRSPALSHTTYGVPSLTQPLYSLLPCSWQCGFVEFHSVITISTRKRRILWSQISGPHGDGNKDFWDSAPCSLVEVYRRIRWSPWNWRQQISLKRR